jgi:hypothetical protein
MRGIDKRRALVLGGQLAWAAGCRRHWPFLFGCAFEYRSQGQGRVRGIRNTKNIACMVESGRSDPGGVHPVGMGGKAYYGSGMVTVA